MLDDIERIEIARGNVSSLYGSGAIGRRGAGVHAPRLGSYRCRTAKSTSEAATPPSSVAGYGGEFGATRLNVSALRLDTRGFSAIDPRLAPLANPDDDGYRNESMRLAEPSRSGLARNHELGVRLLRTRTKIDYDDSFHRAGLGPDADQDLGMA